MSVLPASATMPPSDASPADHLAALALEGQRIEQPLESGGRLVWHTWGRGEPVVLFHGGHGSWTHWVRNVRALARHHAVWAADLPGFGDSDNLAGVTDADGIWPAVAEGITTLIAPGGDAHLVGFSFGSMVAGFIAAERPELVRSLTLVGTAALFGNESSLDGLVSVRRLTDPAELRAAHRQNLKVLMLHTDDAIDDFTLHVQAHNVARDRLPNRRLAHTTLMQTLQARWQCPVQGIWGRHDVLYGDDRFSRLREVLPDCDLRRAHILEGAGHWVQYEAANAFNEHLLSFLDAVDRERDTGGAGTD
ncbi:MAG: alpha/beta fold hydrolase [Pigmentiphaga sp.]